MSTIEKFSVFKSTKNLVWASACFVLCIPSGGALLAKVYGLASLHESAIFIALPCCCALIAMWWWARQTGRKDLAEALAIGFFGGLLGTLAYDLVRVPAHLSGQRIFAPIGAYGVWIAGAANSSRYTDLIGWSYHFSNGLTFGVMYTLWMRKRHWGWGILWGLTLETIALLSPFGRIFYLVGNYQAIITAYYGHIAYGLPLGLAAYGWEATVNTLKNQAARLTVMISLLTLAVISALLFLPAQVQKDDQVEPGAFRVDALRLNPDWLRIERGQTIGIVNSEPRPVIVVVKQNNTRYSLANNARESIPFDRPGIYQLYLETKDRTRSSFVIVEPVENFRSP